MLPVKVLLVSPHLFSSPATGDRKFDVVSFSPDEFVANDNAMDAAKDKDAIVVGFGGSLTESAFAALKKLQEANTEASIVCVTANPLQKQDIDKAFPKFRGAIVVDNYDLTIFRHYRTPDLPSVKGLADAVGHARFAWKNGAPATTLPTVRMEAYTGFANAKLITNDRTIRVLPAGARILNLIAGGDFCGNGYLFNQYATDPDVSRKIIDVQICKLNKDLREAEYPEIESIWGVGRRWPARLEMRMFP